MFENDYIALEMHRIKVNEMTETRRTPMSALKEIIAEHKASKKARRAKNSTD